MRFETRQRIQGTVDEVERALLDERYFDFLLKHHGVLLELQPLEVKAEGDVVRRRVRYRPKPVIQSIGPKQVPPEWFAFVETSTYDKRRKELTFSNVPTSGTISKMLVNTGVLKLKDLGGGQTERTLDGEITLKLPFLMKPLALIGEKVIQSEGLKILDNEVPVLNRFITEVIRKG
ncbi:DUF2505 domain-containing protein [Myxococcus sp. RHSTA-1-4]|uniref:DUF2505 domain-containing protein n=1 Tax=Myxococcus sp. RHSTA-1-4 TaxID=2874601 RepID=UPI001CBD09B6|nr:DUF2505 domain-containing protein [Myxococcus sp. RHSTA-1-4]MBZ4417099.1 DUF2505 domain-containing protein [Myxococcus sp. RHSTA-1-4]